MNLLPVGICLCSPALASSCSFSTAGAALLASSAALPVMNLQAGISMLVLISKDLHLSNSLDLDRLHVCLEKGQHICPSNAALAGIQMGFAAVTTEGAGFSGVDSLLSLHLIELYRQARLPAQVNLGFGV